MTNVARRGPAIAPSVLTARRRPITGPAASRCARELAISITSGSAIPEAEGGRKHRDEGQDQEPSQRGGPALGRHVGEPVGQAMEEPGETTTSSPATHQARPSRRPGCTTPAQRPARDGRASGQAEQEHEHDDRERVQRVLVDEGEHARPQAPGARACRARTGREHEDDGAATGRRRARVPRGWRAASGEGRGRSRRADDVRGQADGQAPGDGARVARVQAEPWQEDEGYGQRAEGRARAG